VTVGPDVLNDERLQFTVPRGTLFAAEVTTPNAFCLVSCVVAPGFDFRDFTMPAKADLLREYPGLDEVIGRLAD